MKQIKLDLMKIAQDNYYKKNNRKKNKIKLIVIYVLLFLITIFVLKFLSIKHTTIYFNNYEKMSKGLIKNTIETYNNIITENECTGIAAISSAGVCDYFRNIEALDNKIDLIARTVIAEVGYDCEWCQILVIDTILNRVDDERFADDISGVVLDGVAFETVKNGMIWKVNVTSNVKQLVLKEMINRTCPYVLAFREGMYHEFGYAVASCHSAYFSGM